jgi:hypothetical protein
MATAIHPTEAGREWFIVWRWQEYEGESRANLLRIAAVGGFYLIQLLQFYVLSKADSQQLLFHQRATALAVGWTMVALAVMLCLRLRVFPAALKYGSTACDTVLLTTLAALGGGPFSPMVLGYFLILAMAALRFSARLVWFSTMLSMVGYESLVGMIDKKWFDANHSVPVVTQLVSLLSLTLTGLILGQVVQRVKLMASEYAQRVATAKRVA